jgi:hypothetical protein
MVYSILYRQRSSKWLDELSNKIEDKQTIQLIPSTILALYIRRKYFVSYSNNHNQLTDSSSLKLTFLDWIDLLLNGNFRDSIKITDWPMKFH